MKLALILPVLPLLFASCASDSEKQTTSAAPARKTMSERMNEDNGFTRDPKGNWVSKNDKRSPYESVGQDPNFQKDGVQKKEYKAGDYKKTAWWGNKDYESKSYTGNTDGSRFSKTSALRDKGAREADTTAKVKEDYQTSGYTTGDAREAGRTPIAIRSNDQIENRRQSFDQPEIIGWKEQRSMSMDRSRGILGH